MIKELIIFKSDFRLILFLVNALNSKVNINPTDPKVFSEYFQIKIHRVLDYIDGFVFVHGIPKNLHSV